MSQSRVPPTKPVFTLWETRASLMAEAIPSGRIFTAVSSKRIFAGFYKFRRSSFKEDKTLAFNTAFDIWNVEHDVVYYGRLPKDGQYIGLDASNVVSPIKINSEIITVRTDYAAIADGRKITTWNSVYYGYPLKDNFYLKERPKWTKLPLSVCDAIEIMPNFFYGRAPKGLSLELFRVPNINTLPSKDATALIHDSKTICSSMQMFTESTFITHRNLTPYASRFFDLWTHKEEKLERQQINIGNYLVGKFVVLHDQKLLLALREFRSLGEKAPNFESLQIYDHQKKSLHKLFNTETTNLLISEDKITVVHYATPAQAAPLNRFSFFKTINFMKIEVELPEGARPVGVLNDTRVVCEFNKMVAVFDVNAQILNYENTISFFLHKFYVEAITKLVIDYCSYIVMPKTPDHFFSSKEFLNLPDPDAKHCSPSCCRVS